MIIQSLKSLTMQNRVELKTIIVTGILISLITFSAYQPAINGEFLQWDDKSYVIHNAHIKSLDWQNIKNILSYFYLGNWTPITMLSHSITYAIFGLDAWGHHLVNVILHSLNTLWVFLLALLLLPLIMQSTPSLFKTPHRMLLAASIIALGFGLHPQHVESVAWISARKDVLSFFFTIPMFGFYLFYCKSEQARIKWYVLTFIFFTFALMSKPIAMTLPLILLLFDVYPLQRTILIGTQTTNHWKTLLLEKVPFFLLSGIFLILTMIAQRDAGAVTELSVFGTTERLLNAANGMIFYISKFLFPIFLSPLYPLSKELSFTPVIVVIFITALCGYSWSKKQYFWLMIWLFYFITLSPVLGFVQVGAQAAADRYTYLPTLPFFFLVGVGLVKILDLKIKFIKLSTVMLVIVIGFGLFHLTRQQSLIWKNDLTLWNYTALYVPDSPLVQANLGHSYLIYGNYEKALEHYQLALPTHSKGRIYYDIGGVYHNAAVAYLKLNRLQEALFHFNVVVNNNLDIGHAYDVVYYQIGWIHAQLGHENDAKIALAKALEINPQHQQAKDLLTRLNQKQGSYDSTVK